MNYDQWLKSALSRLIQQDPGSAILAGELNVDRLPSGRTGLAVERVMLLETILAEAKGLSAPSAAQQLDVEYFAQCVALERFVQLDLAERLHNPDVLTPLGEWLLMMLFAPYSSEAERFERLAAMLSQVELYLAEAVTTFGQPDPLWAELALAVAMEFPAFLAALPQAATKRATTKTQETLQGLLPRAEQALKDYTKALRALRPGPVRHVLGSDRYGELVRLKGYPYSVSELAELGAEKFAKLKEQRNLAAKKISFAGDWKGALRACQAEYPPSFEAVLSSVRDLANECREFTFEKELARPPKADELLVIETPVHLRAVTPFAAISVPRALWPLQRSVYYVTRAERLSEMNYPDLRNVVPHEAYPGHHLQYAVANERGSLIRNLPWNTQNLAAMGVDTVEGWAHYCEALMKRAGFYTAPEDVFYSLHMAVFRAARVVIDVGLQTGRLTLPQAMQMLVDEMAMPAAAARSEVNRYALQPSYNLGYCLGKHLIKTSRGACEKAAGKRLSDADYHELVMTNGQAPLSWLEGRAALLQVK